MTTLAQEGDSRFQGFLRGCPFEALYEPRWVKTLRAGFSAVEDRVTSPESVLGAKHLNAIAKYAVTGISRESICLQECRGT